jgi:putative ABC transport system permease protein
MNRKPPLGVRLYRSALRLLPARFQRERGGAMLAMFEEEWRERRGLGRSTLLATAILDLMRTALLERMPGDGARSSTAGPRTGLAFSWLDLKLGLRMLVKQPGLTLVAVFALSVGIPASLLPWHAYQVFEAPLPFDDGERVVGLHNLEIPDNQPVSRSLHDFILWKEELESVQSLAATRSDPYNVISADGRAEPVRGAEMTATGFRALRVPPIGGRVLLESDEVPGAPDVVVISYDLWQLRLGGDRDAVGSTIRIGEKPHQVVGIMPEGFLFPVRDYLWLPFRHQATDYERGAGPDVEVFGRLADGVSLEQAQAELSALGLRMAEEFPDTHGQLRPEVGGFTEMRLGLDGPDEFFVVSIMQLIVLALLAIVCGNVGTLILARTAVRSGEIATRTALGASRVRIVSQLFTESFVLAVVSAGVGLLLIDVFVSRFAERAYIEAPFWLDFGVTPKTAATALGLAVFCAVIAGVLPALKATGDGVQRALQRAAGGSGIRFGRGASLLIVTEVALAVAFLTLGGTIFSSLPRSSAAVAIDPAEFMTAMARIPWTDHEAAEGDLRVAEFRAKVANAHEELARRLASEPGVRGAALGSYLPGMRHPSFRVEIEEENPPSGFRGHVVARAYVDVGFFEGFGAPMLNGRDFTTADLVGSIRWHAREGLPPDRTAVIVNSAFVEAVFQGGNPIGRRLRYVTAEDREPGPWYEIIGVVGELAMNNDVSVSDVIDVGDRRSEGLYHPVAPGEIHPIWAAVRVGENPLAFTPRLRQIASEIDADAMIQFAVPLGEAPNPDRAIVRYGTILLMSLAAIAIVLSAAGLYALMSFTVSQRTREIGIRTALGARPTTILAAIAKRAFLQLLAGVLAGVGLALLLIAMVSGEGALPDSGKWVVPLASVAAFILLIGMLACVAPTLRGLRIRPVEALKEG